MPSHDPAEVFLKIAKKTGCLTAGQVERLRTELGLPHGAGLLEAERLCLARRLLSDEQVRRLDRAVHYYVVRRADKMYARLAIERGYVDGGTVRNCLNKQHKDYARRRTLVRISKLLDGLDAITAEQDAELRKAVIDRLSRINVPDAVPTPEFSKSQRVLKSTDASGSGSEDVVWDAETGDEVSWDEVEWDEEPAEPEKTARRGRGGAGLREVRCGLRGGERVSGGKRKLRKRREPVGAGSGRYEQSEGA